MKAMIGMPAHFHRGEGEDPHAAIVVHVHPDGNVNLAAFDAQGVPYRATSIPWDPNRDGPEPVGQWAELPGPYDEGKPAKGGA